MKTMVSTGLKYDGKELRILNQQKLPAEEEWLLCENPEQMKEIIFKLQVRGAPLIGVSASLALAQFVEQGASQSEALEAEVVLRNSRPTAVNLMNCLDRLKKFLIEDSQEWREQLVHEAETIFTEDVELCQKMAEHGATLIQDGDQILTHCNTGGLATAGIGTAFGVIQKAHEQGKKIHVYVDETRPLLQGGRLTAWELKKQGIPHTLICDNMAAHLMSLGKVDRIFVGSDRIATNGDFANKIGTYGVAVSAKYHNVPFYVVAPYTTIDFQCASGEGIPIELRKPDEVRGAIGHFGQIIWSPSEAEVYNPAFDVTPAELVSGWVLDRGVFTDPKKMFH